jgi:hypothetical protein
MKRLGLFLSHCAICCGILFSASALAGETKPSVTFTPIVSIDGIEFSSLNSGWFDPCREFDEEIERISKAGQSRSGHRPSRAEIAVVKEMAGRSDRLKLLAWQAAQSNFVIFRLGIMIPDDVVLHLDVGCLNFSLELPDGRLITIADKGIVCPYAFYPAKDWANTQTGTVKLDSRGFFKGRPGDWPVVVYVRLPRSVYRARVVNITPTELLEIVYPASTVEFQ